MSEFMFLDYQVYSILGYCVKWILGYQVLLFLGFGDSHRRRALHHPLLGKLLERFDIKIMPMR